MFDDILVPTDGSDAAAAAADYAADLATHYDATVHVLSVIDSRRTENAPQLERRQAAAEERIDGICAGFDTSVRSVERAVRTGVPYRTILDYADEAGVDLLAMGTHGRTGVERYLLGSVTEKVLRRSDVPVLTVRDGDAEVHYPFEDVLVPTDGSDEAEAAAAVGIDVASRYDATLHVVSVVDVRSMGFDVRSEMVADSLEEGASDAVDRVAADARDRVPAVETEVAYGTPHGTLRTYVEEHDVDIVAMGTHGRSGIERYLLGSVAEKFVRTSPVPVLTVRPEETDG